MRRLLVALTIAAAVAGGVHVRAGDQTSTALAAPDDLVFVRLGAYLEALRVQAGIPGMAAAVVGQNDILWEYAAGQADVARAIPARTDTPVHFDGISQVVTAMLTLRCVEGGWLSLDQKIGQFDGGAADPNATIGQLLTHTSGTSANPVFQYNLDRLASLRQALGACIDAGLPDDFAAWLDRLAMIDSVPGADIINRQPTTNGTFPTVAALERYKASLARLAVPYAVDAKGRPSMSQYPSSTLTPSGGLITTVRDYAKFDVALRQGIMLKPDTLQAAWTPPLGKDGQRLPHGYGWFVQPYNGELVVWQFGVVENASSSLALIIAANSDGLNKRYNLAAGDVRLSPFARAFLGLFIR